MRIVVFDVSELPRPALVTPAPCAEGDRCVKSDVVHTDIDNIIRRFAGNLAEIKAWQNGLRYGEQLNADLASLHEMFQSAHDNFSAWSDSPFGSFAEAAECWSNGTFDTRIAEHFASKNSKPAKEVSPDETNEDKAAQG